MSATPILHHYDLSPNAEKARLAFGLKKLAWRSVEISIWPPRPDLAPLTAGYRRVPVLQIGADIYCDTQLILDEIDRLSPKPSLYPKDQRGLIAALSYWADTTMFMQAATLTTSIIGDGIPQEFLSDRIAFMQHDFSKAASLRELPKNRQRVQAQINILVDMLADGRKFLLGNSVSAADLHAYHPLWFTAKNGGKDAQSLLTFKPLKEWMARIESIGHGKRSTITAEEALAEAKASKPKAGKGVAAKDPCGLKAGQAVRIVSDEAGDETRGTLVAANPREIVISTKSERAGTVHVHFPRFGYSAVAEA